MLFQASAKVGALTWFKHALFSLLCNSDLSPQKRKGHCDMGGYLERCLLTEHLEFSSLGREGIKVEMSLMIDFRL